MTAYNLLNGTYCSHHEWLIKTVLKKDWELKGLVMSDWGAVHDALAAVTGGCDLEMPKGSFMNEENLLPLIQEDAIDIAEIDDKVRRILRTVIAAGFMEAPQSVEAIPLDDPLSRDTALTVAQKSLVLLKNSDRLLPIDRAGISRIALIGPNAHPAVTGGAGSSYVTPNRAVSILDALKAMLPDLEVVHHPGVQRLDDAGAIEAVAQAVTDTAGSADVVVLAVGFSQSADTNTPKEAYPSDWPSSWAAQGGFVESEGRDRPFDLPAEQIRTIQLAASANPAAIVVINAGSAINLQEFIDDIPALLFAWYPGQEGGQAVAEVLFGDIAPSGKLPVTFAKSYDDYPSAPYYHLFENQQTPYTEGIFVGYRGFDQYGVEPAFPFGFGQSYTAFRYADLEVSVNSDGSAQVSLDVTNNGAVRGDEVVQIYVAPSLSSSIPRALKTLAGFSRVSLAENETKSISLTLEPRAFAYWDVAAAGWVVEAGTYNILAAASSRDIRLTRSIEQAARVVPK